MARGESAPNCRYGERQGARNSGCPTSPGGRRIGEASVRKFVAYTATAALGPEHSARRQLCKISLRSCRANPVQVRILLICHSAHESPRSGIKKGVESLLLSYVEAGLCMTHPESRFREDALNRVCAIRTRGDNLIRCAADPAVQGRVKSADGKAVPVLGFSAVCVVSRCTGQ